MKEKFLLPWGIAEEKIEVMPAAINLENYPLNIDGKEITKKYGKHLITSIKTLWETNVKGLEPIVKAMKIVGKKHPEYKYIIFGEGTERLEFEKFVKKQGLGEKVIVAGPIKPKDCKKVWAATEIAPHGFVYEFSTSISLLEYMAMGKACVINDIGNVKPFVGDAALVVKSNTEKEVAEGIIKLIENPKLRKSFEKKARKRVEDLYSIKASVNTLERIYKEELEK